MATSTPKGASIPVILCGATASMAANVRDGLLPEFEVIHIIHTPGAGTSEIPALLRPPHHKPPPDAATPQIGTGNYAAPARAVILGAGFTDHIPAMRAACDGGEGGKAKWLQQDDSKPKPPFGPEYGKQMVLRTRECLGRLAEGKEGGFESGGIVFY